MREALPMIIFILVTASIASLIIWGLQKIARGLGFIVPGLAGGLAIILWVQTFYGDHGWGSIGLLILSMMVSVVTVITLVIALLFFFLNKKYE